MTPRLLCASDVRAHSSLSLPGSHGLGPWSLCCTLIISRHATFANIPYRRRTLAWTFLFLPSCYPCQEAEPLSLFTFPVVACTAGPSCQPNPPPDLLPQLLCLVVLTAAPLRCAPPWPPTCPPGSTPQSHVVGVGCRRIASAIQGGQRGAVSPVQERSGAAAGSRECSGRGPAPQQQRLVQRVSGGADLLVRGDPPGCQEPLSPGYSPTGTGVKDHQGEVVRLTRLLGSTLAGEGAGRA